MFDRGEENMKGYLFGEKKCMHKFCPDCGSSLFVDPHMDDPELIVVNVCVFSLFFCFFFGGAGSGGILVGGSMLIDQGTNV